MLPCFIREAVNKLIPITLVSRTDFLTWVRGQNEVMQAWLQSSGFKAEIGAFCLMPDVYGQLSRVICCVSDHNNLWDVGHLPLVLPEGDYQFDGVDTRYLTYATGWGLGAYQFTRYKKPLREPARLYLNINAQEIFNIVAAIYWVRDLINTPADDMGPTELALQVEKLATQYSANFTQLIGEELWSHGYRSIFTVGRGSDDAPRLLDLRWGDATHPKVTLVGKGVCFDTGGLDIKPSSNMLLMKKDMAGAAHVLGLARMIMEANLPICLRVLIPAVENSVSGNAYRPGDVIVSRKGLTIEVGNTDAEGRLVLCDALAEAVDEKPDLLIDIATLTGAARVAVGTDLAAVFANNTDVVQEVMCFGDELSDFMWQLPLFPGYREHLNSTIADINNNSSDPYAGAIAAGLFLNEFVPTHIPWLHFDIMAWNTRARAGRPFGGEAMAIRALFAYLKKRYE